MKLVSILLAVALAYGPSPTKPANPLHIEDEVALGHFTAGMDAWLAEDYATAQDELEAAYAIEPVPELLYSLGQLARLQGDCVGHGRGSRRTSRPGPPPRRRRTLG